MLTATGPIGRSATARGGTPRKPRLGVVKLASCEGWQLTLLDLEIAQGVEDLDARRQAFGRRLADSQRTAQTSVPRR